VLSVIAGCTDIIGFLSLNGLFTAQVTGNLVLLAAHVVAGSEVQIAKFLLSVPMFMVAVGLTMLLANGLAAIGFAPLRPLLLLQFVLLVGFLILCVTAGPHKDLNATTAIFAGMFGVSAMAVQYALVQVSLGGVPATAVVSTDLARLAMAVSVVLHGRDPSKVANARNIAAGNLTVIVGFAAGCCLGAACQAAFGPWSLALPAGLAFLAFAMAFAANVDSESCPSRDAGTDWAQKQIGGNGLGSKDLSPRLSRYA
jgi:uncharacterized membrane protein YoaK (UPF0700 family)